MSEHTAESMTGQAYVDVRRARIREAVGRSGPEFSCIPLSSERLDFLRREAEELYWNELAWEQITDEEVVQGGHLTEMVFPGFLAFVEGLLARGAAQPHPDAVERILAFLGDRFVELSAALEAGADSRRKVWARAMTCQLIDLVVYRLLDVSSAERERLEAGR